MYKVKAVIIIVHPKSNQTPQVVVNNMQMDLKAGMGFKHIFPNVSYVAYVYTHTLYAM